MITADLGHHAERTALAHSRTSLATLTAAVGLAKLIPTTPLDTRSWVYTWTGLALLAAAAAVQVLTGTLVVPAPARLAGITAATCLAGAAALGILL